ncbi:MAG: methionyl-tRNA formyltransferase [Thermodesulfovibrionales bacterium]
MRIIFFGTPFFALPTLKALLLSEKVIAVITQPDKRKGRDHMSSPPPVKELALDNGIKVLQPANIKDPLFLDKLRDMNPEIIIVVAYGKILPLQILSLPEHGCINVHASLLPKYRGAAPIQWAIINGEKKTGVTTMLMDKGLDTGAILLQKETDIYDDDDAGTLSKRLADTGASLIIETIKKLKEGVLKPSLQEGGPSYAPPLKKEDGRLNWEGTAADIFNFVRGMYPWPCAHCYLNKERIKIRKVKNIEGTGVAGRIEKAGEQLIVGTGEGLISIIELQPEGKRLMTAKDFLQGRRLKEGTFFNESQVG